MSYGAKFNSANGSLLDNMDSANHAIQGKYQGIVLVFDQSRILQNIAITQGLLTI